MSNSVTDSIADSRHRAIVIGDSMAGLLAAGVLLDPFANWTADWLMLGRWKWMPRCSSGLTGRVCSRTLLE